VSSDIVCSGLTDGGHGVYVEVRLSGLIYARPDFRRLHIAALREPPVRIELTTARLQGDRSPVRLGSHSFVHARHLRIRIRDSSPLFALIRGG
jgi:hypothetical protein